MKQMLVPIIPEIVGSTGACIHSDLGPFRCVVCGLNMWGGTYVNGAGPYCPRCTPPNVSLGWQCPNCSRVYAPSVTCCPTCGQRQ